MSIMAMQDTFIERERRDQSKNGFLEENIHSEEIVVTDSRKALGAGVIFGGRFCTAKQRLVSSKFGEQIRLVSGIEVGMMFSSKPIRLYEPKIKPFLAVQISHPMKSDCLDSPDACVVHLDCLIRTEFLRVAFDI